MEYKFKFSDNKDVLELQVLLKLCDWVQENRPSPKGDSSKNGIH